MYIHVKPPKGWLYAILFGTLYLLHNCCAFFIERSVVDSAGICVICNAIAVSILPPNVRNTIIIFSLHSTGSLREKCLN